MVALRLGDGRRPRGATGVRACHERASVNPPPDPAGCNPGSSLDVTLVPIQHDGHISGNNAWSSGDMSRLLPAYVNLHALYLFILLNGSLLFFFSCTNSKSIIIRRPTSCHTKQESSPPLLSSRTAPVLPQSPSRSTCRPTALPTRSGSTECS